MVFQKIQIESPDTIVPAFYTIIWMLPVSNNLRYSTAFDLFGFVYMYLYSHVKDTIEDDFKRNKTELN